MGEAMGKKPDTAEMIRLLSRLSMLTQLGLSVVTPPILCVLLALFLQRRFGAGDWVLLAAILIGIISGVTSVFSFVKHEAAREAKRAEKQSAQDNDAKEGEDCP